MIVRPMRPADLDRVLEIADSLAQAPQWARDVYQAALQPQSAPRRIALVAEQPESGLVVGFLVASMIPPEAELETIGVALGSQRRGIARCLIQESLRILGSEGVTKVILEARQSNDAALKLYGACGFVPIGHRPSYYADPKEDAAFMSLNLPAAIVSGTDEGPVLV